MNNSEKLKKLLINNKISSDQIVDALYFDLLETILGQICEFAKDSSDNEAYIRKEFHSFPNEVATKRIVQQITGFVLEDYELSWICTCIKAYFKKKPRKAFPLDLRKKLLESQSCRCAICNKPLSINETHVDHIIPYDYVGDDLQDNYQILCANCNESKSNRVGTALKLIVRNKKEK